MVDAAGIDGKLGDQPPNRLKVFISYSRADSRFASEILGGLAFDGGFETLIDAHSIHEGEKWKARISALVAEADTCVVVLTTNWLASEMCRFELNEALRLSKRVLPIQPFSLDYSQVPQALASINSVRFDQNTDGTPRLFMDGMTALRSALVTDLAWVREHTRLLSRAAEWEAAGRVANRMLSGSDIISAKEWLAKRPSGAPNPTELHRDYIAASEQEEAARLSVERQRAETLQRAYIRARRALSVASIAALIAAGAGAVAYTKKLDAERSERRATHERDAALIVQSRHLADIAGRELAASDGASAMLLALAGLPSYSSGRAAAGLDRPYVAEIEGRLLESFIANREQQLVAGHGAAVLDAAVSDNGKLLVTASADQTARIVELPGGKLLQTIRRQDGPVNSVAMTPDGRRAVTASGGMAHIVDVATGKTTFDLPHAGEVLQVSLSADGKRAITGSEDRAARVWDVATGAEIARLDGHQGPVTGVALSADGLLAVSGSADATAIVWDVTAATRRSTATGHVLAITRLALSNDAKLFATSSPDRSIRIWSIETGALIRAIADLDQPVSDLDFDSTSAYLAGGLADGTVRIWKVSDGREVQRFSGHTAAATSVRFMPGDQAIVSSSTDKTVRIWRTDRPWNLSGLGAHTAAITALAFDAAGRYLASASRDGTARLGPVDRGHPFAILATKGGEVTAVAMTPDGRIVVTGSEDKVARLWDVTTRKELRRLEGHTRAISSIATSHASRIVATGSDDKTVRLWEIATGRLLATMPGHATRVTAVAFTPDDSHLISGTGSSVRLWDVSTARQVHSFIGHRGSVLAVAVSPNGRTAASGGRDSSVRTWHLSDRKAVWKFDGPGSAVTGIHFTPDGRRVISSWSDGHIRIIDNDDGSIIADIALHDVSITGLAVAAGQLATGDSRGAIRVVPLFSNAAALVARAKAQAIRCLTRTQLRNYHLGPRPPRWCITGPSLEIEKDSSKWLPLWPYQSLAWREWLVASDKGATPEFPAK